MSKRKTEASPIVSHGGWIEQKGRNKPRARLFTTLTVLWVFPSLGALVIIGGDFVRWFREPTLLEGFRTVTFEQWIGLGLLAINLVFSALALHFHWKETPKESVILIENPEVDPNKLY